MSQSLSPALEPGSSAAAYDDLLYRKVSLRIIPFLFLCYVVSFLDRINIGFAQLQMKHDLGFSDAMYGLGAAVFYIGYVLCEVPSNLLLAKFGARRTFTRIMLLWGVASVGMLHAQDEVAPGIGCAARRWPSGASVTGATNRSPMTAITAWAGSQDASTSTTSSGDKRSISPVARLAAATRRHTGIGRSRTARSIPACRSSPSASLSA